MNDHRIIELLGRKMAGEISDLELIELRELMAHYPDAVYYEEIFKQIWANPAEDTNTDELYEKHLLKHAGQFNFDQNNERTAPNYENDYTDQELSGRKWSGYRIPLICTVLLALATAIFFFYPKTAEDQVADTQIISGKGIRKNITLPDGTTVWLNADSKLSYDKAMINRDQRVVMLSGEAFFDVKHDKAHPFIIKTEKISIKVLGTSFNVRAYEDDDRTETTLIRGSVELSVNNRPNEKIILKPSEKFILNEQNNQVKEDPSSINGAKMIIEYVAPVIVANKEYLTETSWKENYLVFKDESLEELAPKLERWYNVKIAIKNSKIKSYRYTGAFSKETIHQALQAMQLTKHFNFKIQDHDIEIY
ncbi:MAG: DUF4974 domain-containing protein [Pedobacter sp.]|nr:MAG: DUF4974 domain-containing protein [Pedobacter sp.]